MDWKKAFKSHLPLLAVGVWVVVGLACNALLPSDTPTDTIVTPPPEVGAPPEAPPAASEPSQTKDEEPPASSPETLLQSITPQELAALDPIGPENAGGLVPLLSFEPGEVIDFSWHPSGGFVAFGTFGHPYVSVWNIFIVDEVAQLGELFNPVHAVSFHPFDDTIMVGDDSEVSLLQFDSGEYLRNIDFPAFPVNEIEISQSGFNGAIGYGGVGGEIGLLDLKSGESIGLYVHDDWITDLAFSPTGQILATSAANGTIKVIDAAGTQTEVHNLSHGEWVDSLAVTFAPFEMDLIGHILASSASGEIKLWDIAVPGGELWTVAGHPEDVKSMVFSVEGDVLASGDLNGTIKLWDTATGAELASFQAHSAEIVELGFSPDGRMLASAGSDGTFRLWTAGAPGTP